MSQARMRADGAPPKTSPGPRGGLPPPGLGSAQANTGLGEGAALPGERGGGEPTARTARGAQGRVDLEGPRERRQPEPEGGAERRGEGTARRGPEEARALPAAGAHPHKQQ